MTIVDKFPVWNKSHSRRKTKQKQKQQRLGFWLFFSGGGKKDNVHTFQLQLRSELSPVAAPQIQHLNVDYSTDVRHNNSTGLKRTRACARFPTQPVSQLLNTFKSTSCVLFVATGARNAIERWTFFFFFFLKQLPKATSGVSWRRYGRRVRGCWREPPAPWTWCWRLLLCLTNSCALALLEPARARGWRLYYDSQPFSSRGGFRTALRNGNQRSGVSRSRCSSAYLKSRRVCCWP